jgi:predicted deacetylase
MAGESKVPPELGMAQQLRQERRPDDGVYFRFGSEAAVASHRRRVRFTPSKQTFARRVTGSEKYHVWIPPGWKLSRRVAVRCS